MPDNIPRPEHPRPQRKRKDWLNLNGPWAFELDPEGTGEERGLSTGEGLTRPLGERGEQIVTRLDSTIGRLDEVLLQASGFVKSLNESEGTLGRLVRDPKLYEELSDTVSNVNRISRELRPIINDVRVFSDKIARHPESLGVRGALDRRPGLK